MKKLYDKFFLFIGGDIICPNHHRNSIKLKKHNNDDYEKLNITYYNCPKCLRNYLNSCELERLFKLDYIVELLNKDDCMNTMPEYYSAMMENFPIRKGLKRKKECKNYLYQYKAISPKVKNKRSFFS